MIDETINRLVEQCEKTGELNMYIRGTQICRLVDYHECKYRGNPKWYLRWNVFKIQRFYRCNFPDEIKDYL